MSSVVRTRLGPAIALAALSALALGACGTRRGEEAPVEPTAAPSGSSVVEPAGTAATTEEASEPEDEDEDDPMALHLDDADELIALVLLNTGSATPFSNQLRKKKRRFDSSHFLSTTFGIGTAKRANQGNRELANHAIGKTACLAGLEGITLQTEEQRDACGGADNMVPIFRKGKPQTARTCIDVFEFPNEPCELPVVWIAPIQAQKVCELQGKRLCTQEEWILACRGDPDGGKDRVYAYGDDLDLEICNTNKSNDEFSPRCQPNSAKTAWKTCSTNTEPTGSFPRCRSRFGVFDQHGNVAEIMTRQDRLDHKIYSQLKGSAFFYVDVARRLDEKKDPNRETYPDHCAYDARWHVEPMEEAWHVNYHLGFRCCRSIPPKN